MQAKDGSSGFDFVGTYTVVKEYELIEYDMDDGRRVKVKFEETPEGVKVTETFDPENENPLEMQRAGWRAILDNFKKYMEWEKCFKCGVIVDRNTFNNDEGFCNECWDKRQPPTPKMKAGRIL